MQDDPIAEIARLREKPADAPRRVFLPNDDPRPDALDQVQVADLTFNVRRHWFWPKFVDGWEPETWNFYRRFIDAKRPVLDLGCWIGPTALFAAALGAARIVAVDGNTATIDHLGSTRAANKHLENLGIINAVLHPEEGIVVPFGNVDGSQGTSSASSTRGTGFSVPTTSIAALMSRYNCADPCLIKIDVEGSELAIREQISTLSAPTLLSLHPPLWPISSQSADEMLAALQPFRLETPAARPLPLAELKQMMLYEGTEPPPWGTRFGNFFEVILLPL